MIVTLFPTLCLNAENTNWDSLFSLQKDVFQINVWQRFSGKRLAGRGATKNIQFNLIFSQQNKFGLIAGGGRHSMGHTSMGFYLNRIRRFCHGQSIYAGWTGAFGEKQFICGVLGMSKGCGSEFDEWDDCMLICFYPIISALRGSNQLLMSDLRF